MGSPFFYLEPHLVLLTLLRAHYQNPAIFSLDYDLVPDRSWPQQIKQVLTGYQYAISLASGNSERVCLAGDSAGGTLMLSLLLSLGKDREGGEQKPGYAALLSPWVTLVSEGNRNTVSDFLNADSLHLYAREYADIKNINVPLASPGCCKDPQWWARAAPTHGFYFTYGSEEVLATEIKKLIKLLRSASVPVRVREEQGAVHAWVIANLFLADSYTSRVSGMQEVVKAVVSNIRPDEKRLVK